MDATKKPVARGDLGRSPLGRVLLGVSRRALDGTLVLWPDGGHGPPDRLRFEGGRFTAAYLVAGGRPESFRALFERRVAQFAFYTENLVGGTGSPPPSNVAALVAASLRVQLPRADVDHELARLGGEMLRLRPGSHLDRFELTPEERQVADGLAETPKRAEQVLAEAADPEIARRVLYLMAIGRELVRDTRAQGEPVEPTEGRSLLPPPAMDPSLEPSLPPFASLDSETPATPGGVEVSADAAPPRPSGAPPRPSSAPPRPSSAPPESGRKSKPLAGPGLYGLSIAPPAPEGSAPPPASEGSAAPTASQAPEAPRTSHVAPAPPDEDEAPYDAPRRYQEALRRLARRDPEGALEALGDVQRRAARAPKLLTLRAGLLLELEGPAAARAEIEALIETALAADPHYADAHALRHELHTLESAAGGAPRREPGAPRPERRRRHSGTSSTPARGLFGWLRGKTRD
ncbi:MAG: hypothetical protein AAF447_15430 [Myxococcota bacterium]